MVTGFSLPETPVFKTDVRGDEPLRWVRLPCALAT
jgi:hypothetical protein